LTPKNTTTKRGLCQGCLQSAPEDMLSDLGGQLLCDACRQRAEKPATRRYASPLAFDEPPAPISLLDRVVGWAREWCAGRLWQWRLPFLMWFGWILFRHLGDPTYQSLFKPLNLGIHELGHYVFRPLGALLTAAGGTILQCLAPVISAVLFVRQRDPFAVAVCLAWLSTNFFDAAVYAGDARAMALPLVTPGGGMACHDWNFMLGRLGLLAWDGTIALSFRCAAILSISAALALGGWLLYLMVRLPKPRPREDAEI
jgi:hypothetical protein